ncbi:MAG: Fur family transcriptional regulator [Candidatus Omnitrophota bacterium]
MHNRVGQKQWYSRLRGKGYRLTIPRRAILSLLNKTSKHLSAEDIYIAVRRTYPAIGLTTVYRTLEVLVGMGIVSKLDFGQGRARYELRSRAAQEIHHHHLICKNCNKVIDYSNFVKEEAELIEKTEKLLENKYGFKIDEHRLQFYGLCSKCRKEKK